MTQNHRTLQQLVDIQARRITDLEDQLTKLQHSFYERQTCNIVVMNEGDDMNVLCATDASVEGVMLFDQVTGHVDGIRQQLNKQGIDIAIVENVPFNKLAHPVPSA